MRLASFAAKESERIGIVLGELAFDLVDAAGRLSQKFPYSNMMDVIAGGTDALAALGKMKKAIEAAPEHFDGISLSQIVLRPPVRSPSKIVCLALNNSANADRIMKGPKHPATFIKPASALIGHGDAIKCRPNYGRVHPEPELALVIGRTAYEVPAERAYEYVFGYTIHNDITSPTMRDEDTFHYRAIHPKKGSETDVEYVDSWVSYPGRYKGSDTFACMGPWLVTKDDIPDPHALDVSCSHNGKLVTKDNTANLFHKTPEVIAFLTRCMTLHPGDIISLGTALKAGAAGGAVQNIDLNRLGGEVSVEIEGIGTLVNGVAHLP